MDGGPCTNPRLNFFIKAVEEVKSIDLMVLTHHDSDHITGLLHYIKKHSTDNPFPVRTVWANCSKHIDFETSPELSSHQAGKLADFLNDLQLEGKIQWRSDIHTECPIFDLDYVTIEILGPIPKTFRAFMEAYEDKESKPVTSPMSTITDNKSDINLPCRELAARAKVPPNPKDFKTLTNMASISFVLRCDGLSVLMLADSFSQEIVECLTQKGYSTENKLKIDFVKISHHGSQHNTSNELLDLIDCDNYIISTNGGLGQSRHPQRETIANILCHPERDYSRTINLYFNYPLSVIQRYGNELFNEKLDIDLNYKIYEPDSKDSIATGYRIPIPS